MKEPNGQRYYTTNGQVNNLVIGWINLYKYLGGRIHCGTGLYETFDEAFEKTKHKKNYVGTCQVFCELTNKENEQIHSNS